MSVPTISIVTPSYNQIEYLRDNLDSIERQTYGDIEHVVLDGGSTDGSRAVIKDYADQAAHDVVWRSEPDGGQSAAINEGFERATGDIIGWLNSDDVYFDRDVLSRVAMWFDRTGTDVIYGDLAYIDNHSRVTEIDIRPNFDRSKLSYRILIGQPAAFFTCKTLETERLDTDLNFCMDYEFWIRLSQDVDFYHVRDVLAGFRRHEEQKTDDMAPVDREVQQMLSRYRDELPNPNGVLLDNAVSETKRVALSTVETIRLSWNPPELAFDGEFAPLPELICNIGPVYTDIYKSLNRWQH